MYVFNATSSAIHNGIHDAGSDEIPSATIADVAQYDYYYGKIAVSIASSSIVIDPESPVVIDTESSTVSIAYNKESSIGNDSTTTIADEAFYDLTMYIYIYIYIFIIFYC